MMQSTKKLSKKRQKKPSRRVDKRTRQVINGTVFRLRGKCGALGDYSQGLYPDQLAAAAYSSERSALRWIKAKKLPAAIQALREHSVLGIIHHDAFNGWRIHDGRLVMPNGRDITPAMIEGLTFVHQRNGWQHLTIAKLEARVNKLEEAVELWRERAGQMPGANDSDMV